METVAELISAKILGLGDWRGEMLARVREAILAVGPTIVEEIKWRGVPVWSCDGILCTGETYKAVVKLTFAKGASLPDPAKMFNASLEGSVRRAVDLREGDMLDVKALQALVREAVAANGAAKAKRKRR
ncbi:MAG: DUF1801 domain-containing protein [Acidobacteriaceae bacterium]|nr:DUF1801 domain-containing protein [Acidobacteriaceae bacterium]